MINQGLINQLSTHFADLEASIQLEYAQSDQEKQQELIGFLEAVASSSPKIEAQAGNKWTEVPQTRILKEGIFTGIVFEGIPGGHEFTSFVLAILHTDGKGKWPDPMVQMRARSIKGPLKVRTFVSLSCTNCPDTVQALNQITLLHPDMEHTMIVGDFRQEEISRLGIQGVPAVFVNDEMIHSGKGDFSQLLQALEGYFGQNDLPTEDRRYEPVEVVVIGGGPAGCASAIYSARKGLNTAVIAGRIGGQVNDTAEIANLISTVRTTGQELASDLRRHSEDYPVSLYENREVTEMEPASSEGLHKIRTNLGETFYAQQVILATGASWRRLGIPGEEDYLGKGVAFCPHCDGPFFKGKDVAVVGGGNSGMEAAIDLAGICQRVTLLEFAPELKADQVLQNRGASLANLEIITSAALQEITGDGKKVTGVTYKDLDSGETRQIKLEGVFVQIGLIPNSGSFRDSLETNSQGEIKVDSHGRTGVPGIYAAGDVTTTPYKQIVIAMGEGAKAALTAFDDRIRG